MLAHAAVVGKTTEGAYCQTFVTGNFYGIVTLVNESVDLELGRNVLAKIEEIVSQTPEISGRELAEIIGSEMAENVSFSLAIAKIDHQKLAISTTGKVAAKLFRKNSIISFSPGSSAGPLYHDDLLILGTEGFFEAFTAQDFVPKPDQDLEGLREEILVKMGTQTFLREIGVLFVQMNLHDSVGETPEEMGEKETTPLPMVSRETTFSRVFSLAQEIRQNPRKFAAFLPRFRRTFYLSLIVFITLVAMIAFQLRSRGLEQKTKNLIDLDQKVTQGKTAAVKLAGVNDQVARENLQATKKDFLVTAETEFGPDWQKQNTRESQKLKAILADLDGTLRTLFHIYQVATLDTFYDFGLLRAGANIVSVSLVKNEIVAFDGQNGSVYSVKTQEKTAGIVAGGNDLKNGQFVDFSGNNIYVWSPSGISTINRTSSPATVTSGIKSSENWGEIRGMKTFGGNLYLLDSRNNQIWKHQGTDLGFASPSAYLKAASVDFSKVNSLAIDGFVYVLSGSGNIVKFASGSFAGGADEFSFSGLDTPLSNPTSFFVGDETENIYVLDSGNNRLVVTDKTGRYKSQYVLPAESTKLLTAGPSVLADEGVKKIFLVSGAKVFGIDIKD